jgi:diadenosine tetraphosphate (Ap4A) HIT family hydrolase
VSTAQLCQTCELIRRRDAGAAPLWDNIYRMMHWDVAHAFNTALPGWIVIVARRHIEAIDQLSEAEAIELGMLLQRVSAALREATGCVKTYVMQFAEAEGHAHVHFHVVPRMANQPEDRRSTRIFGYLGVPDDERVSDETMNEIAQQIQHSLLQPSAFSLQP